MSIKKTIYAALLLCATCGRLMADPTPFFTLHPLGTGVWAAISPAQGKAGSNAGFIIGSDGVLVVDSFVEPAAAQALLEEIHAKTKLPVRYVINTHYHLDHVAGNGVYKDSGALILAQANVRAWEHTENLKFFGDKITPQQKHMVETLVLPSIVYRDGVELYLGDRQVVVRVLPGHTGGDSVVVVPDADVVFTGDMFWNHSLPNLIDADTQAQIASNETFLKDYSRASFVPGHGEVGKAAEVRAFKDYLAALRTAVAASRGPDGSAAAVVKTVLPQLKTVYGGWNYFDYFAQHNIEQTADEMAGRKRVPAPMPQAPTP
jgi:glyoxylase-like metal-dependent hydrolase (beta-lactamase superfamily II)